MAGAQACQSPRTRRRRLPRAALRSLVPEVPVWLGTQRRPHATRWGSHAAASASAIRTGTMCNADKRKRGAPAGGPRPHAHTHARTTLTSFAEKQQPIARAPTAGCRRADRPWLWTEAGRTRRRASVARATAARMHRASEVALCASHMRDILRALSVNFCRRAAACGRTRRATSVGTARACEGARCAALPGAAGRWLLVICGSSFGG